MENEEIIFHPIAYIHSKYKNIEDTPKRGFENSDEGEIEVNPKYLEAMADMKVGEKYMILFYFHKSAEYSQTVRKGGDGPLTALFSTHSPNRPNPIGVSTVTITAINENIIKFKGVDMLDGTPVLDIKGA